MLKKRSNEAELAGAEIIPQNSYNSIKLSQTQYILIQYLIDANYSTTQ